MNPITENIAKFIEECEIATICFIDEDGFPYCINCFYAFDNNKGIIVAKSSPGTHHHSLVKKENKVAGTVLPNEINSLKIKGLQFRGEIIEDKELGGLASSGIYYKKYPFALAMPGYIWVIRLDKLKLTDNTLVFGKKEKWEG